MTLLLRLIAVFCIVVLSIPAVAQTETIDRNFKGKSQADINVGIFASIRGNCTAGPLPAIRLVVRPAHGKVTVKQGQLHARNLSQCLASDVPALIAIYQSSADFSGQDIFTIEVTDSNGKSQLQRITVTVMKTGGLGI